MTQLIEILFCRAITIPPMSIKGGIKDCIIINMKLLACDTSFVVLVIRDAVEISSNSFMEKFCTFSNTSERSRIEIFADILDDK